MNDNKRHELYMRRCIELAQKGRGFTDPNPVVGAVVVKNECIIGEGYHERYGEPHAERNAIADCRARGNDPKGATIYVSLEPCCHHGKQPPCTDAIIDVGISEVIFGSYDPNPKVAGRSKGVLEAENIKVTGGVMQEECDKLNESFFHYITTGTPFVTFKYAMTADGKIATTSGKSKWITGEAARMDVQRLRHENVAIMVGIGTVLADDPMLNCRMEGGRDPIRIVCDSDLRIPLDSQIVKTAGNIKTIITTGDDTHKRAEALRSAGCKIVEGGADLKSLMETLGEMGISSLLIEGGGTLGWSAISQGVVQKVICYMAPKLFGGATAKTPIEGNGIDDPAQAVMLETQRISRIGEDIKIISRIAQTESKIAGKIG